MTKTENVKLGIHIANIHVEGTVSQIFSFGTSFYFNFLVIILNIFSKFYKKKNEDPYEKSETQFPP